MTTRDVLHWVVLPAVLAGWASIAVFSARIPRFALGKVLAAVSAALIFISAYAEYFGPSRVVLPALHWGQLALFAWFLVFLRRHWLDSKPP